jgi:hypothetical protein
MPSQQRNYATTSPILPLANATIDRIFDRAIIVPFEGKSFWKSLEILNKVDPQFSVDLIARQPDDTARRYAQGDPLIREALDNGTVLYERSS